MCHSFNGMIRYFGEICDRRDTLIEGAKSLGITRQGDYVMVKLDTGYRVEYLGG